MNDKIFSAPAIEAFSRAPLALCRFLQMTKPHFNVTAGLILRDGKILITRRPKGSHLEGYWEFPGGKQEENESLASCLEREMQEELRISVRVDKYLLKVDHEYETKSISLHLFQCAWLSGTPTPIGCDEIRWVKPDELTDYQFPPPDIRILEFIRNRPPSSQTDEGYDI